ncbi:LemA family protein [soil metagenome]
MKILIKLIIAVAAVNLFSSCGYNRMITLEENVTSHWSNVENVYQRRADLIPNLVNTVRGYADFERETLTQVIEARSRATATNINAENLTPERIQEFQQAQEGLSSALSRLMVVVERYPELKANQNFLELQSQLEGTENRIAVERGKFNRAVEEYNTYIRQFPQNMVAGMFNFERKGYFEASAGAERAPEVVF